MENLLIFGILIVLSVSLAAEEKAYFKEGGELTLRPTFPGRIVNVLWKLEGDLVAEWIENKVPLEYYGRFIGRTELDITTGHLVMKNLTKDDEGEFSLELNSKVQPQRYISKAIKEVPKPKIWMRPVACNPGSHSECTLSCEGDTAVISEAEPVTYSWKEGDGQWQEKASTINITKAVSTSVKKYTCRIENPISSNESEPRDNPFFIDEPPPPGPGKDVGIGIGVVIGLLLLAGLGFLGYKYKFKDQNGRVENRNGARNEEGDELNRKNPVSPDEP